MLIAVERLSIREPMSSDQINDECDIIKGNPCQATKRTSSAILPRVSKERAVVLSISMLREFRVSYSSLRFSADTHPTRVASCGGYRTIVLLEYWPRRFFRHTVVSP